MDNMVLGEGVVCSTDCKETGVNNNVIVCGASGCGKTMSVIEPRLLETYESSLIVTVTKRRIVDQYRAMFEERGYVVEELNFIEPEKSTVSYDPMQYTERNSDITFLAQAIVKSDPRKENSVADPYWDEASVSLLSAECAFIKETKKEGSFADVLEFHDRLALREEGDDLVTPLDASFNALAEKDPKSFASSCYRSFSQLPIRTAKCVFGTLNTIIDTLFTKELRTMMNSAKKIDFEKLASKKTVLFVLTSAVNPSLYTFVNLFYSQVFKSLFEYAETLPDGKLPRPVHVLCDDFATGGRILNFPEYISIFREKMISTMLLIQSESQLVEMYGHANATTIINNCDTYVYMGSNDLSTARTISEKINLPLEDVLYMPLSQLFVFRRGQRPIITKRYDVEKNPQYRRVIEKHQKCLASKKQCRG